MRRSLLLICLVVGITFPLVAAGQESSTIQLDLKKGWTKLSKDDFVNVNCKSDTWSWQDDILHCNGNCLGGLRTANEYTNFEFVMEWQHKTHAGNSGVFVWSPKSVLDKLPENTLPQGIEIQILDHGYAEN